MRKLKWIAVAVLLLWAGSARAQSPCQPTNSPNIVGLHQTLTPGQFAAQGNTATTINVTSDGVDSNGNAGTPSHKITQSTETGYTFNWWTLNAPSGSSATFTVSQTGATWGASLSGSWKIATTTNMGPETFVLTVIGPAGNKLTQDQVTIVGVSGPAKQILKQDGSSSNVYVLIQGVYSGTPNIDATQCPQAYEGNDVTPTIQLEASNTTSGENQSILAQGATTLLNQNSPALTATGSVVISASAGDTITGNIQGITNCTAIGSIFADIALFRVEYGYVVVKDLGHPGRPGADGSTIFDVAPLCENDNDPPDWQPTVVHSFSGHHTYWWGVTSMFRIPDVDANHTWTPLANFMVDFTPDFQYLNFLKSVIGGGSVPYPGGTGPDFPVPGKCTKYPVNVIATWGSGGFDIPPIFNPFP